MIGRVRLGFKKLNPDAKIPEYAHEGDSGMDLCAVHDAYLPKNLATVVNTGIAAEIPDGYELQVRPRSGLACKGVTVLNAPGTVDSGYRGEINVILIYVNEEFVSTDTGSYPKKGYHIRKGDKIAQLVLAPVTFAAPVEVDHLSATERGTGGFGSTGR